MRIMHKLRMLERLDEMGDLGHCETGSMWVEGFGMVQHRLVQLELGISG